MKLRASIPLGLLLLWTVAAAAPKPGTWKPKPTGAPAPTAHGAASGTAAASQKPVTYVGEVPDTGQFLPDTTVLARVDGRVTRVRDYLEAYFSSYPEYRPDADSAGRVQFLGNIVNKEVMGLTARSLNAPFGFEDRSTMREHTERVLSNILFQRAVLDSVVVTPEDVRAVHAQFGHQYHFRHILFTDRATAHQVHADLVAGRIRWKDAVAKYSISRIDPGPDGDMGWLRRDAIPLETAMAICPLAPGEISPVVQDKDGFHVILGVERRDVEPPDFQPMRSVLKEQLKQWKASARADTLQAQVRANIGMAYDTTNIVWAAAFFKPALAVTQEGGRPTINLSGEVPEFAPADTARQLARWRNGRFTLGDFLHAYTALSPVMRPDVSDFEGFRNSVDANVFEPYMAELAIRRGLDKDSLAVAMIEKRREEIMVEHLYRDSILTRVWISPAERRKYYQDHINGFVTYPSVQYAAITRSSKAAADSVAARLRAGEKATTILQADSLRGITSGSIQTRRKNETGTPYYKLLFEELRPGQVTVEGPDKQGAYVVLQLFSFDPGRQLSYEESQQYVDESLQNIKSERLLKAFLARHRKRFHIETHPELVMQIRFVEASAVE